MELKTVTKRALAHAACAAMVVPGSLFAQSSISLDANGNVVNDSYGQSALGNTLMADPQLNSAITRVCAVVLTAVRIGAAIGLLAVFWNMYLAARHGEGFSGRWRVSFILLIVCGMLLAPKDTLQLFGLQWLINAAGPMGCLVQ